MERASGGDRGIGAQFGGETESISRVKKGMTVRDVDGKKVGKVNLIRLGDPEAGMAAQEKAALGQGLLVDEFSHGFGGSDEPHVPDSIRARLITAGFIRVDGGLFSRRRYAIADQIARVEGDDVHLIARKHDLPTTHMTE